MNVLFIMYNNLFILDQSVEVYLFENNILQLFCSGRFERIVFILFSQDDSIAVNITVL